MRDVYLAEGIVCNSRRFQDFYYSFAHLAVLPLTLLQQWTAHQIYHAERATNFIPVLCVELPAPYFRVRNRYAFVIIYFKCLSILSLQADPQLLQSV